MPVGNFKVDPMQQKLDMIINNPKPEPKEGEPEDRSDMLFSYMNMIAFNNRVDLKLN